jgi:hypothetical protein
MLGHHNPYTASPSHPKESTMQIAIRPIRNDFLLKVRDAGLDDQGDAE